jgi:hypothetical protein
MLNYFVFLVMDFSGKILNNMGFTETNLSLYS